MIAKLLRVFGLESIRELSVSDIQQQRKALEQRHPWYPNFLKQRRQRTRSYAEHEVPVGE